MARPSRPVEALPLFASAAQPAAFALACLRCAGTGGTPRQLCAACDGCGRVAAPYRPDDSDDMGLVPSDAGQS